MCSSATGDANSSLKASRAHAVAIWRNAKRAALSPLSIAHRLQSPDNLQQSSAEDVITPKRVVAANGRRATIANERAPGQRSEVVARFARDWPGSSGEAGKLLSSWSAATWDMQVRRQPIKRAAHQLPSLPHTECQCRPRTVATRDAFRLTFLRNGNGSARAGYRCESFARGTGEGAVVATAILSDNVKAG
jgi:hypothetical protein